MAHRSFPAIELGYSDFRGDEWFLETAISSGGGSFSIGRRQILALARATVRRSKLLIWDEATSAVNYEAGVTVLDAGSIVEFGNPTHSPNPGGFVRGGTYRLPC
ncbi:hypothetical protein BDM02DRAFT_3264035 [Thelephora ganbajun]|uniref:Uncharacterized protein n=1 Tax=Thelephora ganbajun TaxID=370292 RepID=A0ACB6Z2P3_THEGA|nr:hypothetical protein BDM02DRAFT_3264035 [Thelephora ganbajun]